jgi:hypothetical protein
MLSGGVSSKKMAAGMRPRGGHYLQILDGTNLSVRAYARNSAAAVQAISMGGEHDRLS